MENFEFFTIFCDVLQLLNSPPSQFFVLQLRYWCFVCTGRIGKKNKSDTLSYSG